eukprot:GHUV01013963.1.p1 GENE.GHUV01013963.1~~GHUV01013963.1.p1  ORF type:complete len:406 (+),score=169.41 GHUV01013963.1:309-1526(+)
MASSLSDAYQSIKAVLDIFKQPHEPTADVPSKQTLLQAAEKVKADAAKIGLMCSNSTPPEDQLISLATALQQSCVAFCILCHTLTAVAGPTLRQELLKLAQSLVNPCLMLVKEMSSGKDLKPYVVGLMCSNSTPPEDQLISLATALQQSCVAFCILCHTLTAVAGPTLRQELLKLAQSLVNPCLMLVKEMSSGKDLKPYVGLIWDGVSAVPKSSFDNKTCMFKGLAGVMVVIKDTSRELEELKADQQQQQQQSEYEPIDSSSSQQQPPQPPAAAAVSDLDYDGGEMSSSEMQLLEGSMQLIAAAADVLKAFGKALLQGPELQLGSESLDSWESCLFHSRHLRRAVEDLGAAMYPPQDVEEVAGAAQAVFEITELMIDECPCGDQIGSEQLGTLAAALTAAHGGGS